MTSETTETLVRAVMARVQSEPDHDPNDRSRIRLNVARGLAAEGVVVAPERWARLVRDIVDRFSQQHLPQHLATALADATGPQADVLAALLTAVRSNDPVTELLLFADMHKGAWEVTL